MRRAVVVVMLTEEWESRCKLWEGGERWQTWSMMAWAVRRNSELQRNGLWTFPEWTGRFGGRSDGARVGARGITTRIRGVVVLHMLEFVGQHCEVQVQFEWKGVFLEGAYIPSSCAPQSMKQARFWGRA